MIVYKGRLLKNLQIENRSSSCQGWTVVAGHYVAFKKHSILLATDLAANFGCYRFSITPDIVSKLLRTAIWSRCAVQFKPEQTPFLGQVVDLDLLLCRGFDSEHAFLFLCHILLRDQRLSEAMGRGFGRQQLLANSIENFISHFEKSDSLRSEIYKA